MKVVFHPEAYDEMLESARFYEARSEGLGSDFLSAVEDVTRSIQQFPEAGKIERSDVAGGSSLAFHSPFFTSCRAAGFLLQR